MIRKDAHYARRASNPHIAHLVLIDKVKVQTVLEDSHRLQSRCLSNRKAKWSIWASKREVVWISKSFRKLQCWLKVISSPLYESPHLWHLQGWANLTKLKAQIQNQASLLVGEHRDKKQRKRCSLNQWVSEKGTKKWKRTRNLNLRSKRLSKLSLLRRWNQDT